MIWVLVILLVVVVWLLLLFRFKPTREPVVVEPEEPEARVCFACGKVMPNGLSDFTGELCLDLPRPDCEFSTFATDCAQLVVVTAHFGPADMVGVTYFIKTRTTRLGRAPQSEVCLPHFTMIGSDTTIEVEDEGRHVLYAGEGLGGAYVNGELVETSVELRDEDLITTGGFLIKFLAAMDPAQPVEKAKDEAPEARTSGDRYQRLLRMTRDGDLGAARELLTEARRRGDAAGLALAKEKLEREADDSGDGS